MRPGYGVVSALARHGATRQRESAPLAPDRGRDSYGGLTFASEVCLDLWLSRRLGRASTRLREMASRVSSLSTRAASGSSMGRSAGILVLADGVSALQRARAARSWRPSRGPYGGRTSDRPSHLYRPSSPRADRRPRPPSRATRALRADSRRPMRGLRQSLTAVRRGRRCTPRAETGRSERLALARGSRSRAAVSCDQVGDRATCRRGGGAVEGASPPPAYALARTRSRSPTSATAEPD